MNKKGLKISPSELKMGIKVEQEHAKHFPKSLRPTIQKEIALDHLKENPNYYSVLKKGFKGKGKY